MAKVLVVDDDPLILHFCEGLLKGLGHEVRCATSSLGALDVLHQQDVDLVILDVMLTDISGFEFLECMRLADGRLTAPVLMLTALSSRGDVLKACRLGASDYLVKRVDAQSFIVKVTNLLQKPKSPATRAS